MTRSWQPSASLDTLHQRARLFARLRGFFSARGLLEVDTPLLSAATVTDPCIHSLPVTFHPPGTSTPRTFWLQTSPEYAMKRLLAAGSGPIYQICKSFRGDLPGPLHNPEFTMLEWYRPGWDHHALMNEVDELLQEMLGTPPAQKITYGTLFLAHTGLDPHTAPLTALAQFGKDRVAVVSDITERRDWLDLIMTHCIEPQLPEDRPVFVHDFPACQAALAKIRYEETPAVASRFEVYFRGMELANGFHELQDANEQRQRFQQELTERQTLGLAPVPIDERFLDALEAGLPDCAGVALGVDRLLLLAQDVRSLSDILCFDIERA